MTSLSFIFFILLSICSALLFYRIISNYFIAWFVSAFLTSLVFQIVGYVVIGYWDPFIIIAFFIGLFLALIISAIVGVLVKKHRDQKKE
jgi:F0F1-type ATP synthase assembly protein I